MRLAATVIGLSSLYVSLRQVSRDGVGSMKLRQPNGYAIGHSEVWYLGACTPWGHQWYLQFQLVVRGEYGEA